MKRRRYLATITGATAISIAGCSGGGEGGGGSTTTEEKTPTTTEEETPTTTEEETPTTTEEETPTTTEEETPTTTEEGTEGSRSLGESVTYGGLEMSATDYVTVNEFTIVYSDGDEGDVHTSESGAIFLFINISIKNIGETEISFPERGGDIELVYKGTEASNEFTGVDMRANGTMYPNYSRNSEDKGADTGAFPDTAVEGWVIFEVPEGFEQSDAVLTIRHSDPSAGFRTFRWQLGD